MSLLQHRTLSITLAITLPPPFCSHVPLKLITAQRRFCCILPISEMKLTKSRTHDHDSVSVFALRTERISLQLKSPQLRPRVETVHDLLHVHQLIVAGEELVELPKYGEFSNTV